MSSYNWILANQELTIEQLRRLNTRSKIVALSRIQTTPAQTHSAEDTVKRHGVDFLRFYNGFLIRIVSSIVSSVVLNLLELNFLWVQY